MARAHRDLSIALLGQTGSGKSASGNTILGRNAFREQVRPHAINRSKRKTAQVDGRRISVIETPALFNRLMTNDELHVEMKTCARMSFPGLDAFLLVIRLDVGLIEDEMNIVRWVEDKFGADAVKYSFILFTHEDVLNDEPLEDFIRTSPALQSLINSCGGRYHSFNNINRGNGDQATELLRKIEQCNTKHHNTLEEFLWIEKFNRMKKTALNVVKVVGVAAVTVAAVRYVSPFVRKNLLKMLVEAAVGIAGLAGLAKTRTSQANNRY